MSGFLVDTWRGPRFPSLSMLLFLLALLAVGTIFVHSASTGGQVPFPGAYARRHLIRVGIGLVLLLLLLRLDYRKLGDLAPFLYVLGLALLVFLLGKKLLYGGVTRWIHLPGFGFQPSEVVKLFTVLVLARILRPAGREPGLLDHWIAFAVVGIPCLLVALQPDLGTALVLPPALFAMLWVSGVSTRRVFAYLGAFLAVMPLGLLFLKPYQLSRLKVFVQPFGIFEEADMAQAAGYQVKQSIIAIGSGGPTGQGLYEGSQNYLGYLPEDHNDFIFAVIGEEWGLVGTLLVVSLYCLLYLSCLGIAYRTREPLGRLIVVGITVSLVFQTCVNLGMTVGIAPVTGLPLPFLSYGGTSLLNSIASIGIVLGIGMRPVRLIAPDGLRPGSSPAPRGRLKLHQRVRATR